MVERASSPLTSAELLRYSRHLLVPEVALHGQERLKRSRVLVVGVGGLGSPVVEYLSAAGIGRLGLVDDDVVDVTNLQRQTIFTTDDLGRRKVDAAGARSSRLNPHVAVDAFPIRLSAANARELVRAYDVIVDCTDRFASRYLINDACCLERRPLVHASIFRFDGQLTVFGAGGRPCYRCLFPQPPPENEVPSCADGGVLGVLAGIVGTMQANEALKLVLEIGRPLQGRLLAIDALTMQTREWSVSVDPDCPVCGDSATRVDLAWSAEDADAAEVVELSPPSLDAALDDAVLLDVREATEPRVVTLPGTIHIPASELEARLHELDVARRYVVACRAGVASAWAARRLQDAGFSGIAHLRGGLLAYAALQSQMISE